MSERVFVAIIITITVIVLVVTLAYAAGAMVARTECEALDYDWGILVLYPTVQIECEYRLRVPLRDIPPPEGGVFNDYAHL